MRQNFLSIASVAVVVGLSVLSGCAELQDQMPILARLQTAPQPPNIPIRLERLPASLQYRPVRSCSYNVQMSDRTGASQTNVETVTVQAYRDRFLVTSSVGPEQSTALISRNGHKYSYNIVATDGSRLTSDRFGRQVPVDGRPIMNNMDLVIPDFIPGPKAPGEVISWQRDSGGTIQAAFIYRGLATYRGREVAVLTHILSPGGSNQSLDQIIGFSLVDKQRALPILYALRNGLSIRSEVIECVD